MTDLSLGPVSAAVHAALHQQVRNSSIVLWLDRHDLYSELADRLAGDPDGLFRVVCWRGSHLQVLLALEGDTRGQAKPRVVIHLPGFTEADVHRSPLLELWQAGHRLRISLETAVRDAGLGKLPREQIQAYLDTHPESLAHADRWLAEELGQGTDPAGVLNDLPLPLLAEQLLAHDTDLAPSPELWQAVRIRVGLDDKDWLHEVVGLRSGETPKRSEVGFALGSWALCVEFVHDLAADARKALDGVLREPADLSPQLVRDCQAVCQALRERAPAEYARINDQVQDMVKPLVDALPAEQLGDLDTFSIEADKVLHSACVRLADDDAYSEVLRVAARRLKPGGSFWVQTRPVHAQAWQLVERMAHVVAARARCPATPALRDVAHASDFYARHGAAVDRAHRELEQLAERLLPELDRMPQVLTRTLAQTREVWRDWADGLARAFSQVCDATGFLPGRELQQRHVFDQHVAPWADARSPVAYFMVDALRYEMGQALAHAIEADAKGRTTVGLRHALAELPTNTSVGMNVLAPVARAGQLEARVSGKYVKGFRAGARQVVQPKDRQAAIQDRVGGRTPRIELRELVTKTPESLKRWTRDAPVLMVSCGEIDHSGESGAGPYVFETALKLILAGWRRLRQVGVKRFVITADHGFLLLHQPDRLAYGRTIDVGRRGQVEDKRAAEPHLHGVRLSELGYTGPHTDHVLVMPRDLSVMNRGDRFYGFAHGGNSPQERVIPVLTIEHRSAAGRNLTPYELQAQLEPHDQGWVVRGRVRPKGLTLGFAGVSSVALHVAHDAAVTLQPRAGCRLDGQLLRVDVDIDFVVVGQGSPTGAVTVVLSHTAAEVELDALTLRADLTPAPVDALATVPSVLRPAFQHLLDHGLVTESDLFTLLGSARLSRRFARTVGPWAQALGLTLVVSAADGTRYEIES